MADGRDTCGVDAQRARGAVRDPDLDFVALADRDGDRSRGRGALLAALALIGLVIAVPLLVYRSPHVPKAPAQAILAGDRWAQTAFVAGSCDGWGLTASTDTTSSGSERWCSLRRRLLSAHVGLSGGSDGVGKDCTASQIGGEIPADVVVTVLPCVDFILVRRGAFFGDLTINLHRDRGAWRVSTAGLFTWSSQFCFAHDSAVWKPGGTTGQFKPFYRTACSA